MKTVSFDLLPCYEDLSGIGIYTRELLQSIDRPDDMRYFGTSFNFLGKNSYRGDRDRLGFPIIENKLLPLRIYNILCRVCPVPYRLIFPEADLNVFFNYIVPPRVRGRIIDFVYDMTVFRYPETMDRRNHSTLTKRLSDSIARSDYIVTISEFSKREILERYDIPEDRIGVVYCSVPDTTGQAGSDARVPRGMRGENAEYFLYVGTVEPRKNLSRLIRAFDTLKGSAGIGHKLVIAGKRGWRCGDILETAAAAKHSEDVIFAGYVSEEEKYGLYRNASALVFPSLYEGFGIPLIEAMSAGCPVICSREAAIPEVVGDAGEYVDAFDEGSIARGMRRILSDPERSKELIQKGKARAVLFTADRAADKFVKICKTVLDE